VSSLSDRRLKATRQTSRLCAAEQARPAPGRILLLARLTIAVRWGRGFGDGVRRWFRRHCRPSSPPNDPEFCRAGTFLLRGSFVFGPLIKERRMHGLIYLIGLIVVILAILSFFGLR
jgi:hypothetical protein